MIRELNLKHFRCFENIKISFTPGINLVYGSNGSGKTSILEATYLAGRGRSFRTNYLSDLIHRDHKDSIVFLQGSQNQLDFRIGCQISSSLLIKLNNEILRKRTLLLDYFPLQIITPISHQLVDSGPSNRRKFIDWGLFHVEQSYRSNWSQFHRVLKQRNKVLKTKGNDLKSWDEQFIFVANLLHEHRKQYFEQLSEYFVRIQEELIGEKFADITYFPGWNINAGLKIDLDKNRSNDFLAGFTHVGCHKSDIKFSFVRSKRNVLSRGQQKLLVFSLQLSQCLHLKDKTGLTPVLLVDDISSELDKNYLNRLVSVIGDLELQSIISSIEPDNINSERISNTFHVEHIEDN
jgi:DNA replication and repair protein RecF